MRTFLTLIHCMALCAVLASCSTAGRGTAALNTQGSGAARLQDANPVKPLPFAGPQAESGPLSGDLLPVPSALAEFLAPAPAAERAASYLPADLRRSGADYNQSLPSQRVSASGESLVFDPQYSGNADGIPGLAFAMFSFVIPDYDGNSALTLDWGLQPAGSGEDDYLALANWDSDRWDWFAAGPGGTINLPSLGPYRVFGGNLLACVARTGVEDSELDFIRIGSLPPAAVLSANPKIGLTPLNVNFDASASTDSDSTIVEYLWDPEGDGSFSESSGTSPLFQHEYTEVGNYNPAVRVLDSHGVYADATVLVSAANSTSFSYGSPEYDEVARAVIPAADGDLLLIGHREKFKVEEMALFMRVGPDAVPRFARAWNGEKFDTLVDAVLGSDGFVYACGETYSYGEGRADALLQKWSQDGELIWSRTLGGVDSSESYRAILVIGDSIYACGSFYLSTTTATYGFVSRHDLSGNPLWSHTVIGPGTTILNDLAFHSSVEVGGTNLRVCGEYDHSVADKDAYFATYDVDGNMLSSKVWGSDQLREVATGMSLGSGQIFRPSYITGYILGTSPTQAFLTRVGAGAVIIDGPSVQSLLGTGLQSLNLLLRRSENASSSIVLASFNSNLELLSSREFGSLPDGYTLPCAMSFYGQGGFAICGLTGGEAGVESSINIEAVPSAEVWTDLGVSQGTPSMMVLADTPTDTLELSSFEINGSDNLHEALVYLGKF